jgi:hypothetical protein
MQREVKINPQLIIPVVKQNLFRKVFKIVEEESEDDDHSHKIGYTKDASFDQYEAADDPPSISDLHYMYGGSSFSDKLNKSHQIFAYKDVRVVCCTALKTETSESGYIPSTIKVNNPNLSAK